jgi:hypothetical protein
MVISKKEKKNLEICPNHPKSWQFQNIFPQNVAIIFLGNFPESSLQHVVWTFV